MKKIAALMLCLAPLLCASQIVISNGHVLVSNGHPVIGPPAAAPNPLQTAIGTWVNTATTPTASLTSLPTAGHQVFAIIVGYNVLATASNVADNAGGTCATGFTKISAVQGSADQGLAELWWCPSVTAPTGTYTVTATFANSIHARVSLIETSGLTALDRLGTNSFNDPSGSPTAVTASAANTNANDFVIAIGATGFAGTDPALSSPPSAGYTDFGFTQGWGTLFVDSDSGYQTVTGTPTVSASWTSTGAGFDMALIVASFH